MFPRFLSRPLALLSLAAALAAGSCTRRNAPDGPEAWVLAPENSHYGMTYAEWSARWWQWVYEQPRPTNPVMDPTGEDGALGQVDPVWFLAGTFGGNAERTLAVPSGVALFFPIVNNVYDNTNCFLPDTTFSFTDLRGMLADGMVKYRDLFCELDGVVLMDAPFFEDAVRFRAQAPEFSASLPDDNWWGDACGAPQPARFVTPIASDGVWMMIGPMPAGGHTLHFSGKIDNSPNPPFLLDVVYHLTVLP